MKNFLDTSVVRPLVSGSNTYRSHLEQTVGERRYISSYIEMEFMRGFVVPVLNFCDTLTFESVLTVGDALALWSQHFAVREVKTILQFISLVLQDNDLDTNLPADKQRAAVRLASVIRRSVWRLHARTTNVGADPTHCSRAAIRFEIGEDDPLADMRRYAEAFNDAKQHKAKCAVGRFLCERRATDSASVCTHLNSLPLNTKTESHKKLGEELRKALEKGPEGITCQQCKKIGDAVIAITSPGDMNLHHTDESFDYLCPPLRKLHTKVISETAFHSAHRGQT